MKPDKILKAAVDALEDIKGREIVVIDGGFASST